MAAQVTLLFAFGLIITAHAGGLGHYVPGKCICGRRSQTDGVNGTATRVVGGTVMKEDAHKFLVGVVTNGVLGCGGSIISPHHVLTAAHCTDKLKPSNIKVYIGVHSKKGVEQSKIHPVTEIIQHKGYKLVDQSFVINDIAILKVDKITFGEFVQPICIPFSDDINHVKHAAVAGWGVTKFRGRTSTIPRKAELGIMGIRQCMDTVWGDVMSEIENSQKMTICAYKPATDACQGDSGGPLYVHTGLGTRYQIGVVSFGEECANTNGVPGIYTRISYYAKWIHDHIKGEECVPPF